MSNVNEEWRPIPDFAGYEVSSLGNVRCWRPLNRNSRPPAHPRKVSPVACSRGYQFVSLSVDGVIRKRSVHTLVCSAFRGPRPAGMDVAHDDGCPSNNKVENLSYKTKVENMADRDRHGRTRRAQNSPLAKISDGAAAAIFSAPNIRVATEIAIYHGAGRATAKSIRQRKQWRSVTSGMALGTDGKIERRGGRQTRTNP